ncbi:MAG: ADP-ribose pyrophosphatase [Chlamydiales bacterium]
MNDFHHLINQESVFEGKKINLYTGSIKGKKGLVERELVVHPGAVVILPLLDDNSLVMIKNERFAVQETLWELPAGTLESDESPEKTALRELEEETGYIANRLDFLTYFYTSPGFCNEKIFSYVAKDLFFKQQNLDDNEFIQIEILTWEKVKRMISSHEIHDAKTLTTLLYFLQNQF